MDRYKCNFDDYSERDEKSHRMGCYQIIRDRCLQIIRGMSIEIPASDIIRLILQFLSENNLHQSFQALQAQSQICLNMAQKDSLSNSILLGKWDAVLTTVKSILLPEQTLVSLYETIVEDMISHNETEAAAYIINTFMRSRSSSKEYQERILRLEYLNMPNSSKPNLKETQISKRQVMSKLILECVIDAPPQRLVKLLTQSLKFQAQQGIINPSTRLNLFADKIFEYKEQEEALVRVVDKIIKYPAESKVSTLSFSNKGEHLAVGFDDGLIELYNPNQYKIDTKLDYQNSNNFLFHTSSVTCLSFQQTDDMLASGDKSGQLKIWNLLTGKCLRKISTGTLPVSAISFGPDPSHILSAYETIDVYGLKSATVLRSFKGHSAYINSIIIIEGKNEMLTCSKDGSVKVWNYLTQEEMKSFSPNSNNLIQSEISKLILFDNSQRLLICARSSELTITQPDLRSFDTLSTEVKGEEFISWAISGHKGIYVYSCVQTYDKKWRIVGHNRQSKRIEMNNSVEGEIKLMAHHPNRNIVVVVKENGNLEFWRP